MASILRSCHAECQRKCDMLRCFNKSARKSSPCSERSGCERDKIRPARLAVVKNETKFALHAQNMRKSGIPSELGEFCTEYEVSRFLLGEFFHGTVAGRAVLGQIFRADWHCAQVLEATRRPPCRHWWGIAPREAVMHRVAGVSAHRVASFPRCSSSRPTRRRSCCLMCCWFAVAPLQRSPLAGITKPPGARPGGGGAGDGNRTRL